MIRKAWTNEEGDKDNSLQRKRKISGKGAHRGLGYGKEGNCEFLGFGMNN